MEIGRRAQELQATRISPIAPFLIADSMDPATHRSRPSCCNSRALVRSLILNDSRFFFRGGVAVSILTHRLWGGVEHVLLGIVRQLS